MIANIAKHNVVHHLVAAWNLHWHFIIVHSREIIKVFNQN